ncbi:MAG: hypothetical protein Q8Q09_15475 [Deltaproteobacteria bacterium]|nr:hypothetical protein [Deltaproteobacteria bacterium]
MVRTSTCQSLAFVSLCSLAMGCTPAAEPTQPTNIPPPVESRGTSTPIDPTGLPSGHPVVPVGDPTEGNQRVGRGARRLSVDQLRASLLAVTGHTWIASRSIPDPESPSGRSVVANADMLEALAPTLGRADFLNTTLHATDPAVTFSKLASDAARNACRRSVADDVAQSVPERRRLLRNASPTDTAANAAAIRQNLTYLARRFWGRTMDPMSAEITGLFQLFSTASTTAAVASGPSMRAAGTPADGWRTVCIAMATDTQFLTY